MAACLAHILPLIYHCPNSWQVVQWIWIILDSQMNHSQRHSVHTDVGILSWEKWEKNWDQEEACTYNRSVIPIDRAVTWYWSALSLRLGCKDVTWQKQASSVFLTLISMIHVFRIFTLITFCYILKTDKNVSKRICLVCTHRLSNGSCIFPL